MERIVLLFTSSIRRSLEAPSLRIRALVVHAFPDGAVIQHMIALNASALYLQGHCMAHVLQLVWDTGAGEDLGSPLYGFVQLMANGASNIKVRRAMESLAAGAQIEVGIEPANPEFNRLVLDYTVRRRLLVQSFFT